MACGSSPRQKCTELGFRLGMMAEIAEIDEAWFVSIHVSCGVKMGAPCFVVQSPSEYN
jgi:hypothetical protein